MSNARRRIVSASRATRIAVRCMRMAPSVEPAPDTPHGGATRKDGPWGCPAETDAHPPTERPLSVCLCGSPPPPAGGVGVHVAALARALSGGSVAVGSLGSNALGLWHNHPAQANRGTPQHTHSLLPPHTIASYTPAASGLQACSIAVRTGPNTSVGPLGRVISQRGADHGRTAVETRPLADSCQQPARADFVLSYLVWRLEVGPQ